MKFKKDNDIKRVMRILPREQPSGGKLVISHQLKTQHELSPSSSPISSYHHTLQSPPSISILPSNPKISPDSPLMRFNLPLFHLHSPSHLLLYTHPPHKSPNSPPL
ncbi:hypothetical protein Droror1_Dr00022393 [Drosera rotundifolia]